MLQELMDDFLFPASVVVQQYRAGKCELPAEAVRPICTSQMTITAAFDLIVVLCTGCVDNLRAVVDKLLDMYYAGETCFWSRAVTLAHWLCSIWGYCQIL